MTPERKAGILGAIIAALARAILATCRFEVTDRAGLLRQMPVRPPLWAFWHNRLFVAAYVFERYFPGRPGAALASPSKDGQIISAVIRRFGIRPIRGSSSRRGMAAFVEMKRAVNDGYTVAVTPDGPRGPRYHVNPGIVKLAQVTGSLILPFDATYSSCWRLKSWDGFMIPKPFARIELVFGEFHEVLPTETAEEFEAERLRLERVLQPQRRP